MPVNTDWISDWAAERAAGSPNYRLQWQSALQQLAGCALDAEARRRLFEHAPSPGALTAISQWLQKEDPQQQPGCMDIFYQAVDDSAFATADWLEAIASMHKWLQANGKRAPFSDLIGYLECCAAAAQGSHTPTDFAGMTESMLEEFGFEAAD